MTEKEKHLDIREKLRNLPSVQASDDFVLKLQRRINMADAQPSSQIHKQHQEKLEGGFLAKLFGPGRNSWMVPAMGVTAVVFLVFIWVFVINQNNVTTSNEDTQNQTMTSNDSETKTGGDDNSLLEQKTTLGETLKTELPGREITESFGYVGEDRRELSRGDMEGGTTDELSREETPTVKEPAPVKMVEEKPRGNEIKEEKTTDGLLKTDDKVKTATMPGKTDKTGNKKESNNEKKASDTEKDTNVSSKEKEARNRVARNIIDQTDLENLQEKVEESIK